MRVCGQDVLYISHPKNVQEKILKKETGTSVPVFLCAPAAIGYFEAALPALSAAPSLSGFVSTL